MTPGVIGNDTFIVDHSGREGRVTVTISDVLPIAGVPQKFFRARLSAL